jgi:hypothetical protein
MAAVDDENLNANVISGDIYFVSLNFSRGIYFLNMLFEIGSYLGTQVFSNPKTINTGL